MDEQLQAKLIQYLEATEKTISDAAVFVESEAPLVAQEIVNREIVSNGLWAVVSGSLAAFFAWLVWKSLKTFTREEFSLPDEQGLVLVVGVISTVCGSLSAFIAVLSLDLVLSAIVAPRLLILEKLAELL